MISEQRQALARRAVACKHWRWVPGMWIVDEVGGRGVVLNIVKQGGQDCVRFQNPAHTRQGQVPAGWCIPDLSDPCTLGALLSLVREAWDEPHIYLEPADSDTPGWLVMVGWLPETATMCLAGSTEAEALVCALEEAPSRV